MKKKQRVLKQPPPHKQQKQLNLTNSSGLSLSWRIGGMLGGGGLNIDVLLGQQSCS